MPRFLRSYDECFPRRPHGMREEKCRYPQGVSGVDLWGDIRDGLSADIFDFVDMGNSPVTEEFYTTDELIDELERQIRFFDAKPGDPEPMRDLMVHVADRLRQYREDGNRRHANTEETLMMSRGFKE
jgi:hypothetical protein